ncbi:MAG: S-layer homology domain-containing protein [Cyanobacteria bacterium P01_D01_bin.105]
MFAQNRYSNAAIALSSALTITLAASVPPAFIPAAVAQVQFSDVPSSYWASQYVQSLAQANVIGGFPDGSFRPNEEMTRAQFASILSSAFPLSTVREAKTFSDVPADHWAAGAISSAYAKGFLSGYPDGTFGLDRPITRLEVLLSLASGLGIDINTSEANGSENNISADELLAAFDDKGEIPSWAVEAIAAATNNQLIVNYPNVRELNPNRNATRSEIAAIAHQALVSRGRANAINSPYVPVVASNPAPGLEPPAVEPPTVEAPSPEDEFADLVASLGSENTSDRKAAADALAAEGEAAVPELANALASDSVQTRAAAAYALNEIGEDAAAATPTLLDAIQDSDELVRALATSTLAQVGLDQDILVSVMVAALQSETGLVKDVAADALVNIGGNAVPALGEVLKNDAASTLAKEVAATLIGDINQADELGDRAIDSVIPILAETLGDGDSSVRIAAAETLGDFGPLADVAIPALSRALLGEDSGVSETAASSLLKIGRQSVPGLTEALNSDDALTRLYAADALWTLTQDSSLILPTLVSSLADGNVETRELAALSLTYLGRQALPAVPALRNLLGSDNSRIINIAQLALLILNNNNDPAPALNILTTEPEERESLPVLVEVVSQLWQ